MMRVKLFIMYKKNQIINETCKEKNIKSFMKRIISQNKINIQSGVSFLFLDHKYRLLSLSSKVPEKLLVIAIDIKELYERNELLNNRLNINIIKPFIYNIENIIIKKQEETIVQEKENIELTKEDIDQIIKPVIIKEKKIIKNIDLNQAAKTKNNNNTTKDRKKVLKPNYIIIKKENIKIIKKNASIISKKIINKINNEKKTIINKQNNNKPNKIKMIINLKKDYTPLVTVLKIEKPQEKISVIEHIEKKYNVKDNGEEQKKKHNNLEILTQNKDNKEELLHITKKNIIEETIKKEEKEISVKPTEKKEIKTVINPPSKEEKNNLKSKILKASKEKKTEQVKSLEEKKNNKNEMNKTLKTINNQEDKTEEIEKIEEENMQQNISYSIISPDNEVLYHMEITNLNPMTVEDLLLQSGLEINNSNGFVESINGIENKGMSGWVFEVNNLPVMVPASKYIVNPSDQITWKYVDFSKMMEKEKANEEKPKSFVKQNIKGGANEKKAA